MKLKLEGLYKGFDQKDVLKDINFEFEEGKIYGLLGRNGAGKTTLFNCISEEIDIELGKISLIDDDGNTQKFTGDDVGYVLSTPVVPDFLTGREFLKFFIEVNEDKIDDVKEIDEYFDMLSIDVPDRDILMKDYSHGMRNKMQMIVNLVWNPNVVLLDEPLTSFDVIVAEQMKNLLRTFKKDRILILSTHILDIALDICDEIVVLHKGKLELIDKDQVELKEFKERIIERLKDDEISS